MRQYVIGQTGPVVLDRDHRLLIPHSHRELDARTVGGVASGISSSCSSIIRIKRASALIEHRVPGRCRFTWCSPPPSRTPKNYVRRAVGIDFCKVELYLARLQPARRTGPSQIRVRRSISSSVPARIRRSPVGASLPPERNLHSCSHGGDRVRRSCPRSRMILRCHCAAASSRATIALMTSVRPGIHSPRHANNPPARHLTGNGSGLGGNPMNPATAEAASQPAPIAVAREPVALSPPSTGVPRSSFLL